MSNKLNPFTIISLSTVRLEAHSPDGVAVGTGFFYNYPFQMPKTSGGAEQINVPVIVTNKHVLNRATSVKLRLSTYPGDKDISHDGSVEGHLPIDLVFDVTEGVIGHPDPSVDLCVFNCSVLFSLLPAGKKLRLFFLDKGWQVDNARQKFVRPIESVIMLGYPNGLWDEVNNRPVARSGLTASHPFIPWNGQRQFLIDMACFPGSSGSPVFLTEDGLCRTGADGFTPGTRADLIGILWGGPLITIEGRMEQRAIPTGAVDVPVVNAMMNLGYVIPANALDDFETLVRPTDI